MSGILEIRTILIGILGVLGAYLAIRSVPATLYFLTHPLRSSPVGRLMLWLISVSAGLVALQLLLDRPQTRVEQLALVAVAIFGRVAFDLYSLRRAFESRSTQTVPQARA